MLLDRSKPNDQQGFGDYLNELGYKNGFGDIRLFKIFLAKSSKRKYPVCRPKAVADRMTAGQKAVSFLHSRGIGILECRNVWAQLALRKKKVVKSYSES